MMQALRRAIRQLKKLNSRYSTVNDFRIFTHTHTETLSWEVNVDPEFKAHWWNECQELEEGRWGKRMRLFYHIFYGEGFVIHPGETYRREEDQRPFAGDYTQ